MIGSGLKKLAKQHCMTVSDGVAYGSLKGYATTLSEGAGYKRIDIAAQFKDLEQQVYLQRAVNEADINKEYRVQNWGISPRRISIIFTDTIGTMKKLEAFIEWFYPLLEQCGAVKADVCAECGTEILSGSWYMINGVAYHLHDTCADRVQGMIEEEMRLRQDADTGSYIKGAIGAVVGAALGAVVWAVVLYLGYVASVIGLLIGWLADKGYDLLHGKQGKGKVAILIIAIIFGVLLGTVAPDAVTLAQMIGGGELTGYTYGDIPAMIVLVMTENTEYMGAVVRNALMGLLFAALGVFALLKKTSKEVSGSKMKKLN